MIIFLYGADSYRSKEKLDEIVAHYKEIRKSGLNLTHIDADRADFSEFYDHFKISSMFAETKLVVLKNVFSDKQFQEDFLAELKTMEALKDVVVIYEADEPDKRLKLFKTLTKTCKSQEFLPLDAKGTRAWAAGKLKNMGAGINNDALETLVSFTGNDLWRLSGELQKLASYAAGRAIKKDDVAILVRPRLATDIFKTIDALAGKDKKAALDFLHQHLEAGDNALYLLSMVAYQIRNLLMVKELAEQGLMYASIVKKSGLHPFVVKKTFFACRQFSLIELKNHYRRIFDIDCAIKSGRIDSETALDLLVSQM
jgi:DNA polymerase-3 subunit delta